MRWYEREPKVGDTRVTTPFALLPKKMGNHTIWLERYFRTEAFEMVCTTINHGRCFELRREPKWVVTKEEPFRIEKPFP